MSPSPLPRHTHPHTLTSPFLSQNHENAQAREHRALGELKRRESRLSMARRNPKREAFDEARERIKPIVEDLNAWERETTEEAARALRKMRKTTYEAGSSQD